MTCAICGHPMAVEQIQGSGASGGGGHQPELTCSCEDNPTRAILAALRDIIRLFVLNGPKRHKPGRAKVRPIAESILKPNEEGE